MKDDESLTYCSESRNKKYTYSRNIFQVKLTGFGHYLVIVVMLGEVGIK